MAHTNSEYTNPRLLAHELLEAAKADTSFMDLYLQRARELLATELDEAQYARLGDQEREIADLTTRVGTAFAERDWPLIRDLTRRATDLTRILSERSAIRTVASRVYGFDTILVDPFSPGISGLAGVSERELPALREAAVKRLERLRAADPAWADLYEVRSKALSALRLTVVSTASDDDAETQVANLEARAQTALMHRDLSQLHELSAQLLEAESRAAVATDHDAAGAGRPPVPVPVLAAPLPPHVCDSARKLGLGPYWVESEADEIRARFRPSWRATLGDPSGNTVHFTLQVPGDTEEALREAAALFMSRAFVTSAGTRYIPLCVGEDVLVEDFEESSPDAEGDARPPLLAALGLPSRRGLARSTIEKALRERGAAVVKDLGLDPREYRIVCVPADVYARLGSKLGWGRQAIWTHFDGYMASKDRKLMPLVGGDVRFGGVHDLVAVGSDYDSDRLSARFAVVQRRRFATW